VSAFDTARLAMLAEAQKPRVGWVRRAVMLILASLGTALVVGVVASLLGKPLELRITVVPLVISGAWLAFAATRPGRGWMRWVGAAAAIAVSIALVATRHDGSGAPHSHSELSCTALHVLAAVPAVVAALWLLRSMAPSWVRALCAGLAAGVTGAVLGEMLCAGDAMHVMLFHLTAWTGLTALVVLVSSRLSRSSWAP